MVTNTIGLSEIESARRNAGVNKIIIDALSLANSLLITKILIGESISVLNDLRCNKENSYASSVKSKLDI